MMYLDICFTRMFTPRSSTTMSSGTRASLIASRVLRVAGTHRPAPSLFYYPGLTSKAWHERSATWAQPWIQQLEASTGAILEEYQALNSLNLPSDYEADQTDHASALHTGAKKWHWASLIDRGVRRPQMMARCPTTTTVLESIPGLCVGDMPFAFAFFSTLAPKSKIAPHCAPANLRLRVHLPLLVPEPERCGIRVAGETRQWEVGKALIFDDAFEHETWNDGDADRVVLLFDLWHPDLSPEERVAIQAMFADVDDRRRKRAAGL